MLQSTSLRRLPSRADDRAFDPASTAPPVVSPADPFAPPAVATPSPSPLVAAELEPDDDEIVILSTSAPEPAPPPTSAAPERQTRATGPEKAPAKKAAARTAATTKSPTAKSPTAKLPTTKSPARKSPTGKVAAKKAAPDTPARKRPGSKKVTWVEPDGGVCPTTHPVKAKLRSAIFHLPGMAAYARTNPDRCYRDEAAALDDGLRKAAR